MIARMKTKKQEATGRNVLLRDVPEWIVNWYEHESKRTLRSRAKAMVLALETYAKTQDLKNST